VTWFWPLSEYEQRIQETTKATSKGVQWNYSLSGLLESRHYAADTLYAFDYP
jgi:hypothetical protein